MQAEAMNGYVLIDDPRWAPLEKFVLDPHALDDWMWVEAWVQGDKRVEVYKHWRTRTCIHLDERGRVLSPKRLDKFLRYIRDWEIKQIGRPSLDSGYCGGSPV